MITRIRKVIKNEKGGLTLVQGIIICAVMVGLTLMLKTAGQPIMNRFNTNWSSWVDDSSHV